MVRRSVPALCLALLCAMPAASRNWEWDQSHDVFELLELWFGSGDQDKQHEEGCCREVKNSPFFAKTGQAAESAIDITVPGIGPELRVVRHFSGTDPANGLLGAGWRTNIGKSIARIRNEEGTEFALVKGENGQKYRLARSGNSYSTPPGRIAAPFTLEADGEGWTLTEADGTVRKFDATGSVTSITDTRGLSLVIEYNSSTGCPIKATNASGNTLEFAIGPNGKVASVKDNLGRQVSYSYDDRGNLLKAVSWDRTATTYTYNADNQLTSVTDRTGRLVWSITYGPNGKAASYVENGAAYQVAFYAGYNRVTNPDGTYQDIAYNDQGVRTQVAVNGWNRYLAQPNPVKASAKDWTEDGNGKRTLFTYDDRGRMTSRTDPLGGVERWTYDGNGNVTSHVDPEGIEDKYEYDAKGNLAEFRRAAGSDAESRSRFAYDAKGNLAAYTDPRGNATSFTYDASGRRTGQTTADGAASAWTYDSLGHPAGFTDALGHAWRYHHDANGYRTSEVNPLGDSTAWAWDAMGRLLSARNPLGHVTRFEYDANGRKVREINPVGDTTHFRYDWHGGLIYHRAPGSPPTRFVYDAFHRLSREIVKIGDTAATEDANDLVTAYTYDGADNITAIVSPGGKRTGFTYDALNRVASSFNGQNEYTAFQYDKASRDTAVAYPNGRKLRKVYDAQGRGIRQLDNLGILSRTVYDANGNAEISEMQGAPASLNRYDELDRPVFISDSGGAALRIAYDDLGRVTETRDTLGNITRFGYDALGRTLWRCNALGDTTRFEYDALGNTTALLDPAGNRTEFTYDSLSRNVKTVYPTGLTESFTYDRAGRLLTRTDGRGVVMTLAYDEAGRLKRKSWSDATPADTFSYDEDGALIAAGNSTAALSWTWDGAGRPLTYKQVVAGKTHTLSYSHLVSAGQTRTTYPDAAVLTRFYDFRERLDSVALGNRGLVGYTFMDGLLTGRNLGSGLAGTLGYDRDARLTDLKYARGGTSVLEAQLGYDGMGRKVYRDNRADPAASETYGYDKVNQLIAYARGTASGGAIPAPIDSRAWTLDSRGNWSSHLVNGSTETREHNGLNQITRIGSQDLAYDSAGNLTADPSRAYAWDGESRLASAGGFSYGYDPLGRRVLTRRSDSVSVVHVFDGDREVFDDSSTGGKAAIYHGRYIDEVLAVKTDTLLWFAVTDENYNVVDWYSVDSMRQGPIRYSPYGEPFFGASGTPLDPTVLPAGMFGFQGKRWDFGAGAWNSRARMLSPSLGRFTSPDGMGYEAGDGNLYRFAFNNPVELNDPSGNVVPLIVAWKLAELGLLAWSAYEFGSSLVDPCATAKDKVLAGLGLIGGGAVRAAGKFARAAIKITNPIPSRMVRVIDARFINSPTLGSPGSADVFVTAARDIRGIKSSQGIANRLTLLDDAGNLRKGPFAIIEFDAPTSGIASPVFRKNPGFVQGGLSAGGAREFVIPNMRVDQLQNITTKIIP